MLGSTGESMGSSSRSETMLKMKVNHPTEKEFSSPDENDDLPF